MVATVTIGLGQQVAVAQCDLSQRFVVQSCTEQLRPSWSQPPKSPPSWAGMGVGVVEPPSEGAIYGMCHV